MTWLRWGLLVGAIVLFLSFGILTGEPPVLPAALISGVVVFSIWRYRNRLPARLRPKNNYAYLMLFWILLFGGAAVLDYTFNLPVTERERDRVAAEFASIPQPIGAEPASYSAGAKPGSLLVDATYRGSVTWAEARNHLDRVLQADGWTFEQERPYGVKGGRVVCYRRDRDLARLWLPEVGAGYTYSFSISWQIGQLPRCF